MTLTLLNTIKPSSQVLFQSVGDEAVLLSLSSAQYFGLDPVGTRIWTLIRDDGRLQRVFDVLCAEFAVEPAMLQRDLLDLAAALAESGLVDVE